MGVRVERWSDASWIRLNGAGARRRHQGAREPVQVRDQEADVEPRVGGAACLVRLRAWVGRMLAIRAAVVDMETWTSSVKRTW